MGESTAHVKLWLGNLSPKLTEYQLLRVCEAQGQVSSFDFLYTITEAGKRHPRGYAFVTFTTSQAAESAIKTLGGRKVLGREMVVRLANPKTDGVRSVARPIPAALKAGGSVCAVTEEGRKARIRALESQLARLEGGGQEEFRVVASQPASSHVEAAKSASVQARKPYSR